MEKGKVIDRRQVKLENVMKEGYIPFLGGRPLRDTIIGSDDMVDLRINLNVTGSVEDFLKLI